MKTGLVKLFVALGLAGASLLTTTSAFAQARASTKNNVISVDLLGLAQHQGMTINYEWKNSTTSSWMVRGWFDPSGTVDYTAVGVGAAYRFYIADSRALTGFSVAPAADMYFFSSSALNRSFNVLGVGADAAYKWIFDNFAVEPILEFRIVSVLGDEGGSGVGGTDVHFGANLGYAW